MGNDIDLTEELKQLQEAFAQLDAEELTINSEELHMHTEYTLKIEFHCPNRDAMATFIRACRAAAQELSMQGAILSGDTPIISFVVENNEIGVKKLKIFNGEG